MEINKKIIFTTDLLRIQDGEFFGNRILNWAYTLLVKQIQFAVNDKIILCNNNTKDVFDAEKFYKLCGYELTTKNWVNIYNKKYSKEAIEYFYNCFDGYIILTQEGGALLNLLKELNIPYIDFYISGVRFCSDLFFAFRSNIPEIQEKLKEHRILEEQFYIEAYSLKTYYNMNNNLNEKIRNNSLLLCGQTSTDLSLISNGKIVSFLDYKSKIKELFLKYNTIYYKPHPYSDPESETELYIRNYKNIKITDFNTYNLLSCDNIEAVAALSSGILKEAKYFDKKIHTISHTYISYWEGDNDKITSDQYIIVSNKYRSPVFWADILSPLVKNVKYLDIDFLNCKNFLRNTLQLCWGYERENDAFLLEVDKINKKINEISKEKNMINMTNSISSKSQLYKFLHLYWLRNKK